MPDLEDREGEVGEDVQSVNTNTDAVTRPSYTRLPFMATYPSSHIYCRI
jgi:hypothetical protein